MSSIGIYQCRPTLLGRALAGVVDFFFNFKRLVKTNIIKTVSVRLIAYNAGIGIVYDRNHQN